MTDTSIQVAEETSVITEDPRVEVTVDGDQAIIRMMTYADGIGWFVQKTIRINAEILDSLADQFSIAREKIKRDGDDILLADLLD